jgi:hypothetical protein
MLGHGGPEFEEPFTAMEERARRKNYELEDNILNKINENENRYQKQSAMK